MTLSYFYVVVPNINGVAVTEVDERSGPAREARKIIHQYERSYSTGTMKNGKDQRLCGFQKARRIRKNAGRLYCYDCEKEWMIRAEKFLGDNGPESKVYG